MNAVPQLYPSDVTAAMFSRTPWSREPDLQIYSIAQWSSPCFTNESSPGSISYPEQCLFAGNLTREQALLWVRDWSRFYKMSPVHVLQMSPVQVLQVQSSPCFTTCHFFSMYRGSHRGLCHGSRAEKLTNHGYLNFALKLFTCHAKYVCHGSRGIFF